MPSTDLLFSCAILNIKSQQLLTISQLFMWHYVKKARLGKIRQVNFLYLVQFLGCDYNPVIVSAFLQSKWFSITAFWCPVSGFFWIGMGLSWPWAQPSSFKKSIFL